EAVTEQAERLMHVCNLFYTEAHLRLAERLSKLGLGGKVFFCNSGAEANECAIKLARRHRAGGEIVVLENAFHGRTLGALSATPQRDKQEPFEPLVSGFVVVPPGDPGPTFAGGPVGAAAANAVLDVAADGDFLAHVRELGDHLEAGLRELPVDNVRGRGLMLAFDVDEARELSARALLDQRLVVN